MPDVIMLVEDEAAVRKTFQEWLAGSKLDVEVLAAGDAEQALAVASKRAIDLAVLDWNLGAGQNGLQLLEDLHVFQPDVVSILITGYANQATPLDALRLGVRDYLDKSHELTRDRFLAAISKQLEKVRPIKREREIKRKLERFRMAVKDALPRLETVAALHAESDPMEDTVSHILTPLCHWLGANDAILQVRRIGNDQREPEQIEVYDRGNTGNTIRMEPFHKSLGAAILSMSPESLTFDLQNPSQISGVSLNSWEAKQQFLIGIGLSASPSVSVVLELAKTRVQGGKEAMPFTKEDREKLIAVVPFLQLALGQFLGERASQEVLYRTLRTALVECESVTETLGSSTSTSQTYGDKEVSSAVSEAMQQSVTSAGSVPAEQMLALAEVIQNLAKRHGRSAVDHAIRMLSQIEQLLDEINQ